MRIIFLLTLIVILFTILKKQNKSRNALFSLLEKDIFKENFIIFYFDYLLEIQTLIGVILYIFTISYICNCRIFYLIEKL